MCKHRFVPKKKKTSIYSDSYMNKPVIPEVTVLDRPRVESGSLCPLN